MPFTKPFIGVCDRSVFVVTAHMPDKVIVAGVARSEPGARDLERKISLALAEEPKLEIEITEMPVNW